jgi:DNA-binding CsgD family transcriptional regulator/PAS domain-containing protein
MAEQNQFLDLVYDAALQPDLWVPVLERLADQVGGNIGWLSQLNVEDGSGISHADPTSRIDPKWTEYYAAYFEQKNPLHNVPGSAGYMKQWTPRVLTDEDWIAKDVLVRSEFYNDFLLPQDVGSAMMIRLAKRGSEIANINIGRSPQHHQFDGAEIELANSFHPHLIRAFNLGRKLAGTRQAEEDLQHTLDRSPHGLFLLDAMGVIRQVNKAGEALLRIPGGLQLNEGRLVTHSQSQTRKLLGLVACAASPSGAGGSMALDVAPGRLPISLTIAPLTEAGSPYLRGRTVLVCATDLEAGTNLPEKQLRELFGLTPAETRLALALLEGVPVREAAGRFGTSQNTTRSQLARIFDKTGTNRQSDLVRLLMRMDGLTRP